MPDDDKPKLLRFSDVNPEMRRLDKAALDQARLGEDQLESDWREGKTPESDHVPKGLGHFPKFRSHPGLLS